MAQATVSRLQKVVIFRLSVILKSHTVKSGVDAIHHGSGPEVAFAANNCRICVRLFHDMDQNENKKSFVR
jgi:hypothetical protein